MPALKKEVCQKCYRYHEHLWREENEEDWENHSIVCPVDHFNTILYKGKPTAVEKPVRNLFGAIFGWVENDKVPKWCQFTEEHGRRRRRTKKDKKDE